MDRSKSFYPLDVSAMTIHLAWATLDVVVDAVEDIQVLVSGNDSDVQELKVQCADGMLLIEQPDFGLSVSTVTGHWMQVYIRVPAQWRGAVNASTLSGRMYARGLTATDLSLSTTSGDLRVLNLQCLTAHLGTVSGVMNAVLLGCDTLRLHTVSGDVTLEDSHLLNGRLSSVSGNLRLGLTQPLESLHASTVSGSLALEAPISAVKVHHTSINGRLQTWGVALQEQGIPVTLTSVSGNLEITGVA